MKKSLKAIYNIVTFLLFNTVFYLCNYYPRHIIEISSLNSLFAILLNLIFYTLFFSIAIIVFKKNKTIYCKNIFNPFLPFAERFEIKCLFKLLSVQIIIDLVYCVFSVHLTKYCGLVSSVLTLVGWVAFYLIITNKKLIPLNFNKHLVIALVICGVFFLTSVFIDFSILNLFNGYVAKYQADSPALKIAITNLDYYSNLKNYIFDTIIAIVLVISHFASANTESNNEQKEILFAKFSRFSIRIMLLILFSFALTWIKCLIFPYSTIYTTDIFASTNNNYLMDDSFYASSDVYELTRTDGYKNKKLTFQKTVVKIYCNQEKLCSISLDGDYRATAGSINGNVVTMDDKFNEYEILGQKVSVLEDLAICYHENSGPKVITFNQINSEKENKLLTATIKRLVSEGNVLLFANSYEYLKQYDLEFAEDCAKRYLKADFTDEEYAYIDKIDYQIDFLQSFIKDK